MFEYLKDELARVSFNRELFLNELSKNRRWLTREEYELLEAWININYPGMLGDEFVSNHSHRLVPGF